MENTIRNTANTYIKVNVFRTYLGPLVTSMALNNITKLGWRRVSNLSSDAAFNDTMFDFGIKCPIKSYIQYLLQYTTYVD